MTGHAHGRRSLRRRHFHGHQQRDELPNIDFVLPEPAPELQPLLAPTNAQQFHTLNRRSDCAPDDNSPMCEKPAGAQNNTLPILLGALWVSW